MMFKDYSRNVSYAISIISTSILNMIVKLG